MDEPLSHLGTVLVVWAHPDDETYLVGGLSAALSDAGQRVVCVTATRGEAGGTDPDLADIRTAELDTALDLLGVREHHWLDYPDGGCASVDDEEAAARVRAVMEEVRPDTVVTFGPDGYTGHPDHQAVSRWVDLAASRPEPLGVRLLHAVAREHPVDPGLDEDFGVFELGRPRVCADDELAVLLPLDGALLDRKIAALLAQESQTAGLVAAVGLPRFRAWVATEALADPAGKPVGPRGALP
jgi:LmbE family N-acetylglucosaminyl deacetylase